MGFGLPVHVSINLHDVVIFTISANWFATKTCCFLFELLNHFFLPLMNQSNESLDIINCRSFASYTAARSSNLGTVMRLIGSARHFPITKVNSRVCGCCIEAITQIASSEVVGTRVNCTQWIFSKITSG